MTSDKAGFSWGVVGSGVIARQFADDLRHVAGARIGGFHARTGKLPDELRAVAPDAKIYATLEGLLAADNIDAIYIATPNALHAEQALAAINARKPVLVEKPLATNAADAGRIEDAAVRAGVFVMEAMWSRFLPAMQAAREIVNSGEIGELVSIKGELAYWRDEVADARFFDPALGGGASLDLGVYPLSVAMFLAGEPTGIDGEWRSSKSGVDMSATYRLRSGDAEATLACGFDRDGSNHLLVTGTRGALLIHPPFLKAKRLTVFRNWAAGLPLIGVGAATSGKLGSVLSRLPLPGRSHLSYGFEGGGLQFEAKAVMDAVRAGSIASDISQLAHSRIVLGIIETVLALPPVR